MAQGIIELNESNFDSTISSGVVLVDFWAPWCGPCRMQGQILEGLVSSIGDKAVIAKVNVDENPNLAARYGVRSIPTLILFKDGEISQQFVGVQDEATLTSAIESA